MTSVHIDLSCAQDVANAERGIPTYARDFCAALIDIESNLNIRLLLNSWEPMPKELNRFRDSGHLMMSNTVEAVDGADIFLDLSPFYRAGLPRFEASKNYGKVGYLVHDLIPFVFPDKYLGDYKTLIQHKAKLERLRHADFLLSNSSRTTQDIKALLPFVPPIFTVGTGISPDFTTSPRRALESPESDTYLDDFGRNFILYTGGTDWRKNIEGLIAAYSMLPNDLSEKHPLVIVCELDSYNKAKFSELILSLELEDRVTFTGKIERDQLIWLYRNCELFVFPSFYEGFGLPVVEALECGAKVICGDNSYLQQLIPDRDSRFDASSAPSITKVMMKALGGEVGFSMSSDVRSHQTWKDVALSATRVLEKI